MKIVDKIYYLKIAKKELENKCAVISSKHSKIKENYLVHF